MVRVLWQNSLIKEFINERISLVDHFVSETKMVQILEKNTEITIKISSCSLLLNSKLHLRRCSFLHTQSFNLPFEISRSGGIDSHIYSNMCIKLLWNGATEASEAPCAEEERKLVPPPWGSGEGNEAILSVAVSVLEAGWQAQRQPTFLRQSGKPVAINSRERTRDCPASGPFQRFLPAIPVSTCLARVLFLLVRLSGTLGSLDLRRVNVDRRNKSRTAVKIVLFCKHARRSRVEITSSSVFLPSR